MWCSECSLIALWVLTDSSECSLSALWVLSECSLSALWVLSECSLSSFWLTDGRTNRQSDLSEPKRIHTSCLIQNQSRPMSNRINVSVVSSSNVPWVRLNKGCNDIHQSWICLNVSSPHSDLIIIHPDIQRAWKQYSSPHNLFHSFGSIYHDSGNSMIISQDIPRWQYEVKMLQTKNKSTMLAFSFECLLNGCLTKAIFKDQT